MTNPISMSGGLTAYVSFQPRAADTSKLQEQLFSKVDTNGDKSIDQTELTSFLDYVSEKTGTSIDSASALEALDSDGNGSISESELQENASALFDQLRAQLMGSQMGSAPPPPGDPSELFSSIDSDSDGSISKTELESFMSDRAGGSNPDRLLSALISRYTAAGSSGTDSATSLSIAA